MSRLLNKILSLDAALWLCLLLAGGSVALAFIGAERASAFMGSKYCQALTLVLAHVIMIVVFRAIRRKRFDSALLHLGCACVMFGWIIGQQNLRTGSMALIDGDRMDSLWKGPTLQTFVEKLPFTVRLEKFTVDFYENGMPREYRSRITILEEGKEPRTENVRVNHPAYVHGYHIYQMSWGESVDNYGRPVTYTVLQFIRDPGLPVVYAGFVVLLIGTAWFMVYRVKATQVDTSRVKSKIRPDATTSGIPS